MDIVTSLINRLYGKKFDDFTKIRYIYLYLCNVFSYDSRFYNKMNPQLRKEIYNKKLDIRNVNEFEIVCSTFSQIMKDILEVFGYKCEIVDRLDLLSEEERKKEMAQTSYEPDYKHTCVVVNVDGYRLKLDPTDKHDTARVKLNLQTYGFEDLNCSPYFLFKLSYADGLIYRKKYKLSHINDHKQNEIFYRIIEMFRKNPIEEKAKDISSEGLEYQLLDIKDITQRKIEKVFSKINSATNLTRHADMDYYISYLLMIYDLKNYVKPYVFYNIEDNTDIIEVMYVKISSSEEEFYILKKENGCYKVESINEKELLELLDGYDSNGKYHCENVIKKVIKRKGRGIN